MGREGHTPDVNVMEQFDLLIRMISMGKPTALLARRIFLIRGQRVLLDRDLALLYGVETRVLNQSVMRNRDRFPKDFMFQLSIPEAQLLVSQNVIPHAKYFGGHLPRVFAEHGVAMLSSVLRSPTAIRINIRIMRAFAYLRRLTAGSLELAVKLTELEGASRRHDREIQAILGIMEGLRQPPPEKRRRIGFLGGERGA